MVRIHCQACHAQNVQGIVAEAERVCVRATGFTGNRVKSLGKEVVDDTELSLSLAALDQEIAASHR